MGIWQSLLVLVRSQWSPRRPTIHSRQQPASASTFTSRHVKRMYLALILGFVCLLWLQVQTTTGSTSTSTSTGTNHDVVAVGWSYPVDSDSGIQPIETTMERKSTSSQIGSDSSASSLRQDHQPTVSTTDITPSSLTNNNNNNNNNNDKSPALSLRFDWRNLRPSLELTRRYVAHQSNCSLPLGDFVYRNQYGMGSDLHFWGRALCNGLATGRRIRTIGNWTWLDRESCSSSLTTMTMTTTTTTTNLLSPMLCYFPVSELQCPQDSDHVLQHPTFDPQHGLSNANGGIRNVCQAITQGLSTSHQRMAGLEYLFLHLSPLVIQEAERQLHLVFRGLDQVPSDLITVHIRWGDKKVEMRLVGIQSYISAVKRILDRRGAASHDRANIYLATEDPAAVKAFQAAMPVGWNLYLDQFYVELLPHRVAGYNGNPEMARKLEGKAGLVTLGSLLVAMEANDFVLTTASNWSRMMNELRQSIVDPRCGNNNCTHMIDLRKPMKGGEQR
jgi:hypothetical protein